MSNFSYLHSIDYNGFLMSSPFLNLFKQIADGVAIFEPFRRETEGLREFQDIVHRLQEIEH
jgi:hypothetical protein